MNLVRSLLYSLGNSGFFAPYRISRKPAFDTRLAPVKTRCGCHDTR